MYPWKIRSFERFNNTLFCLMVLRLFVKINLLFRVKDPLNRKSPTNTGNAILIKYYNDIQNTCNRLEKNVSISE